MLESDHCCGKKNIQQGGESGLGSRLLIGRLWTEQPFLTPIKPS